MRKCGLFTFSCTDWNRSATRLHAAQESKPCAISQRMQFSAGARRLEAGRSSCSLLTVHNAALPCVADAVSCSCAILNCWQLICGCPVMCSETACAHPCCAACPLIEYLSLPPMTICTTTHEGRTCTWHVCQLRQQENAGACQWQGNS
jgi:hypothetical protein